MKDLCTRKKIMWVWNRPRSTGFFWGEGGGARAKSDTGSLGGNMPKNYVWFFLSKIWGFAMVGVWNLLPSIFFFILSEEEEKEKQSDLCM